MSPAQVVERSYLLIKQHLLNGVYAPGTRLEAARLADEIDVSITPVRDVLNRLTGEGLVRSVVGDGFTVPVMNEQDVRDLLQWNAYVLAHALRPALGQGGGGSPLETPTDEAKRAPALFLEIVMEAGNGEFVRAMNNSNDRLQSIRNGEAVVLTHLGAELDGLEAAWRERNGAALRERVRAYHRRRQSHVADLVRQANAPGRVP